MTHRLKDPPRIITYLDAFTAPSTELTTPLVRRQSRLLASLLLGIIPLGFISGVIQVFTVEGFLPTFIAIMAGLSVLSTAYYFSRTRYYQYSALTTALIPTLVPYASLVSNPADLTAFSFLLIGVLLSSILLTMRFTIMIVGLNLVGIILLPLLVQGWHYSDIVGPLFFHIIISALILIFMRHRDLVERDRQAILKQSEEKYRTLFTNSHDTICVSDFEGNITDINPAGLSLFDYNQETIKGIGIGDLFVNPSHYDYIQEAIANEQIVHNHDIQLRRKDGQIIDCLITASPREIIDSKGIVCQAIIRDVTEWKRVQEEMLEAKQVEAELQKEREIRKYRTRFLSMFSHEFRTPLSSIRLLADMLHSYYDKLSPEKRQERFETIIENVDEMDTMVEDLIILNQIGTDPHLFSPKPVEIKQFLLKIVDRISRSFPNRNILQNIQITESTLSLDEKLMNHVLVNILTNALKYSPDDSDVEFLVESNDQHVSFTVKDQGIGIPDADLEKIFDLFHRAENVGERNGSGLGLAIVQEFVDLHQGMIHVESVLDQGTSITVTLPIRLSSDPQATD